MPKAKRKRKPGHYKPDDAPPEVGTVCDMVAVLDRAYFDAHPGERVRVRDYVPGEVYPYHFVAGSCMVRVTLLGRGVRTREFINTSAYLN